MVTPDEVKKILDTGLDNSEIEAYISGATELVSATLGSGVTDLKKEIVRWLTAHMIASTREQQLSEAGAGSARAKFQGETGLGLDSTHYGQQVKILDTSGKLAMASGKGAEIFAIRSFE